MIPVYALGEMLGYDVNWVGGKSQRVDIANKNHTINLYIGYPNMKYDGKWLQMAVAPIITGNRTLVPARFVVEAFGLNSGMTIPCFLREVLELYTSTNKNL